MVLLLIPPLMGMGQDSAKGWQRDFEAHDQFPTEIIKTNPLSYLWGPIPFTARFGIGLEKITSRQRSTQLDLALLGKSPILHLLEDSLQAQNGGRRFEFQVSGGSVKVGYRWYLNRWIPGKKLPHTYTNYAPQGYYLSTYASYSSAHIRTRSRNSTFPEFHFRHVNLNLVLGRQYFYGDHLVFDAWAGMGWQNNVWKRKDHRQRIQRVPPDDMGPYAGSMRLSFGFSVGYYWGNTQD